jgi:hypothetical protein
MTKNWLYPLSRTAGRWFAWEDGTVLPDVSYESFVVMMRYPGPDNRWTIAMNFRNVGRKDRVWCYYGVADGDRGVVGLAYAERVEDTQDGRVLVLRWDRRRTRYLLQDPVPAAHVRRFVPYPRAPVIDLDSFGHLVAELELHAHLEPHGKAKRTR